MKHIIAIPRHYLLYIALTLLFRIVSQRKKYVIVRVKFFVQCSSRGRRRAAAGAGGGRAMATYATRSLQPTQTDIDVSNFEVFAGKQRWHRPLSLQIPKGFRGVSLLALLL